MKLFQIMAICLTLAFSANQALAAKEKETRKPASKKKEATLASCKMLDAIAENAGVANGSAYVSQTTLKRSDADFFKKADADVVARYNERTEGDCGKAVIAKGRGNTIKKIQTDPSLYDEETGKTLKSLWTKGGISAIVGAEWNGKTGDGPACSIYYYDVYSPDGCILSLEYDVGD